MVVTPSSNSLSLTTTSFKDILLVQLPPRLSVVEAVPFRNTFQQWVQQDPCTSKIILDFSKTILIDSSGIGSLLGNLKTARLNNIQLILWSLNPQVNLALSLAGLDQLLTIEAHTEATIPVDTRSPSQHASFAHPSVRSPIKRAIDITSALIGLGVMGLVLVPIAIAIKRDSPGPIFVRQQCCGLMGRRFYVWQFRSRVNDTDMSSSTVVNPAEGVVLEDDHAPPMATVGCFLRQTGLEGLPQCWNVLKGDMSLIGTHLSTPEEIEQYEVHSWQRLDVKPGLIRVWQLNGRSKNRPLEDVIRLDLRYQENWSLLYDFKLVLKRCLWFLQKDSSAI
jgi:anti-anti-sigma factor